MSWAATRAKAVTHRLQSDYGKGWDKLSAEQRRALVAEQVLILMLAQAGTEFSAAQELVRDVLAELS